MYSGIYWSLLCTFCRRPLWSRQRHCATHRSLFRYSSLQFSFVHSLLQTGVVSPAPLLSPGVSSHICRSLFMYSDIYRSLLCTFCRRLLWSRQRRCCPLECLFIYVGLFSYIQVYIGLFCTHSAADRYDLVAVPWSIFSHLQVSFVGLFWHLQVSFDIYRSFVYTQAPSAVHSPRMFFICTDLFCTSLLTYVGVFCRSILKFIGLLYTQTPSTVHLWSIFHMYRSLWSVFACVRLFCWSLLTFTGLLCTRRWPEQCTPGVSFHVYRSLV